MSKVRIASMPAVEQGDSGRPARSFGDKSMLKLLRRKSLETAIGGSSADCVFWRQNGYNQPESFHELSCSTAGNTPFDFGGLKGKVVICVNVASL